MNIAPADADVFDPDAYAGQTHVTPPEREALAAFPPLGLRDVVRERWPAERVLSYWDYRAGMFHQDLGMRTTRLDGAPAARVEAAWMDRRPARAPAPAITRRSSWTWTRRRTATSARSSRRRGRP